MHFQFGRESEIGPARSPKASIPARNKCYDPMMEIEQIIALLVSERNSLNAAIQALQGPMKRRGRLPGKASAPLYSAPSRVTRRRKISATGRKAMAAAAKKRWAAIKSGKAPNPFAKR
jgi:hypothetical protein